jgi:hypothetical protein
MVKVSMLSGRMSLSPDGEVRFFPVKASRGAASLLSRWKCLSERIGDVCSSHSMNCFLCRSQSLISRVSSLAAKGARL